MRLDGLASEMSLFIVLFSFLFNITTNVTKIGTVNRAVSVGMVGLASSKIGKTHKCNDCGSTW